MMIFLTGAPSSISKSGQVPQTDTAKSLGGYVSTTPVPNGELNALFDLISTHTKEKRRSENLALALVNTTDSYVTSVTMCLVVGQDTLATFKVAAVGLSEDMAMEHISNRYAEPMQAEFHNADFQRAFFDMKILTPATEGSVCELMGVEVEIDEYGMTQTCEAFVNAFEFDELWSAERLNEDTVRFTRRDEMVYTVPEQPTFVDEGSGIQATFTNIRNGVTNTVTLVESGTTLAPGNGIGLWVKRMIRKSSEKSNEQLLKEYRDKTELLAEETVELIVNYDLM